MVEMVKSWTIVANSNAGSADKEFVGRAAFVLAGHAPLEVVCSHEPEDVVRTARQKPDTTLVIAGGDGTLSRSVGELISAGFGSRPVGLLPGGTGNDFLRGHGVPLDAAGAAASTVESSARPVNAMKVRDLWAINAVHVGLGASPSRRASAYKPRLGPLAYTAAAVIEGTVHGDHHMRIEADGEELHDGPALMAALALGRTIGAGTVLSDTTALSDSPGAQKAEAELLVFSGTGAAGRLALGRSMLGGAPSEGPNVTVRAVSDVIVRCESGLAVNVDGEDEGDAKELSIRVTADTWTALLPEVAASSPS